MNLAHHSGLLRTGVVGMLLLLGGCAGNPPAPAAALAGTSWQLESIGSPADSGQALQIADAARYSVTFGADGRASLRLDCNRGHGSYTQQPAADGVCPEHWPSDRWRRRVPCVRNLNWMPG